MITVTLCKWCGDPVERTSNNECRVCEDARYAAPVVFKWVLKMLKYRG